MYCIYKQNTHGILLENISTCIGLFRDDFPIILFPSETWTHPPTSIVSARIFVYFAKPLSGWTRNVMRSPASSPLTILIIGDLRSDSGSVLVRDELVEVMVLRDVLRGPAPLRWG